MTYDVEINGRTRRIEAARRGSLLDVTVDGRSLTADVAEINGVWSLILDSSLDGSAPRRSFEVAVVERPAGSGRFAAHVNGRLVLGTVAAAGRPWSRSSAESAGPGSHANAPQPVVASMPGKIVKLLVRPGDSVAARQPVVVVEAMKMENELRAPKAGTVVDIRVVEGASVDAGAVLAVIE